MNKKYYAVIKGLKTGIFDSWNEAKKYVTGYKGAVYKSFPNLADAKKYVDSMNMNTEIDCDNQISKLLASDSEKGIYSIFVDGSFNSIKKKIGFGVVCWKNKIIYEHYNSLNAIDTKKYLTSRNVAGEIFGSLKAIEYAIENKWTKIKIYFDYEGIEKWATKAWEAKSEIACMYVKKFDSLKNKVEIQFQKVKAHANLELNEIADKLAKKAVS